MYIQHQCRNRKTNSFLLKNTQIQMEAQEAEIEMLNAVQVDLVVKNDHDIKTHQRDALGHHLKALLNL